VTAGTARFDEDLSSTHWIASVPIDGCQSFVPRADINAIRIVHPRRQFGPGTGQPGTPTIRVGKDLL
jgi:hypothetical protein